MKILVTGAAGFIGFHLCTSLLNEGHDVIGIDNFYTGKQKTADALSKMKGLRFLEGDVRTTLTITGAIHQIYHLACPASPRHYQKDSLLTLDTCYLGTRNVLELARSAGARVLIASTSEIYGDAEVHPQDELYRGAVNPYGPRACYDEGKRISESLAYTYKTQWDIQVRIARIFNTYGPGMNEDDGRVMTNLIVSALNKTPMPIYGTGEQTRSFCFVSDQVAGLTKLMNSDCDTPVNIGNPHEVSILKVAEIIRELTSSTSPLEFHPLPIDDPKQRCPDIRKAREQLHWEPVVSLKEGLKEMIYYYDHH